MDDMKLPAGKTCSDCRSWARCKRFIGSLTGKETTCDWAPSRFEESNESLMRQIEAQKEEIATSIKIEEIYREERDDARLDLDIAKTQIESQKKEIETLKRRMQRFTETSFVISEIESLKAITEQWEAKFNKAKDVLMGDIEENYRKGFIAALKYFGNPFSEIPVSSDSEIERLSHETNLP